MAEEQIAITEVMNLLEAEPSCGPVGVVPDFAAPGSNIPALREQLAELVSTGKAKEAIGVQLTYKQVKHLSDKDVEKYYKRYEAFVGAKTKTNSHRTCGWHRLGRKKGCKRKLHL